MLRYSSASLYFGRWLLYITVGGARFIVCIGDVFLKGIECAHPAALIFTGVICSFVYVNIIYALSISFKHIGKALCVLLVILQIPGSSGTYPVEMTPAFFQNVPSVPTLYLRYFRNERMYCRNVRKHLYTQSAHPAPFRSRFLTDRTWDQTSAFRSEPAF